MLIKTVRLQYWKKAMVPYLAFIALLGIYFSSNNAQFMLLAALPIAYLLWGTGSKCPNCHNAVQRIHSFLVVPWCPKKCYTCSKNLSKR